MEWMNVVALATIVTLGVSAVVLLAVYVLRVLDYLLFPITKYTDLTLLAAYLTGLVVLHF